MHHIADILRAEFPELFNLALENNGNDAAKAVRQIRRVLNIADKERQQ